MKESTDFLTSKEVEGVWGTLNDGLHPLPWMFYDTENGIGFVHYVKWIDGSSNQLFDLAKHIFDKYCSTVGVQYSEIDFARVILLVQAENERPFTPSNEQADVDNLFVYVVSSSDKAIVDGGKERLATVGRGFILDNPHDYHYASPYDDNFSMFVEVSFK